MSFALALSRVATLLTPALLDLIVHLIERALRERVMPTTSYQMYRLELAADHIDADLQ
jgi:hypothetical protein